MNGQFTIATFLGTFFIEAEASTYTTIVTQRFKKYKTEYVQLPPS